MSQGSSTDPSAPGFSVGEPETAISHERMKEVDIRGIDGSLYALNAKGQWKWFGTNLVRIVYAEGPRDNPFESVVAKSELAGLPDAYTDTRYGFAEDHRWGDGPTLANVYFDPDSGHILGFMHTEWTLESKDGTYFRLGMAISKDVQEDIGRSQVPAPATPEAADAMRARYRSASRIWKMAVSWVKSRLPLSARGTVSPTQVTGGGWTPGGIAGLVTAITAALAGIGEGTRRGVKSVRRRLAEKDAEVDGARAEAEGVRSTVGEDTKVYEPDGGSGSQCAT
ncbi:MAG: hypothetical protein ACYTKD_08775 [Planctomycetota bacterium]